jgi:hypothetical protein
MIRTRYAALAASALLLAFPAIGAAAAAPPAGALVGHDAAGNSVAVWTASDGSLQTARQVVGHSWSRSVVLYTPSRLCKFVHDRCTSDAVSPTGLVVNAAGQAFFAVMQHITGPDMASCDFMVAGRASTHRTGGQIGTLSIQRGQCGALGRHVGKVFSPVTAIAPDGTATLAYIRDEPRLFESDVFFGTFPRGSITADVTAGAGPGAQKNSKPVALSVGIDRAGHATLLYYVTTQPAVLRSLDIIGSTVVDSAVSVPGELLGRTLSLGPASLTIAADGSQQAVYGGSVLVGNRWMHTTVIQTRSGAGQPWSAPVAAP